MTLQRTLVSLLISAGLALGASAAVAQNAKSPPTAAAPAAPAAKGPLDGKTFKGKIWKQGETKKDDDTFEFADGTLHSTACDEFGFKPAPYAAKAAGKATGFDSVATSDKDGATMTWKGTFKGETLKGTAVWSKGSEKPSTYEFMATLKK
jgi:hypothetical protein